MKSWSWLKKATHIYVLNLVLVVTQITAIGGILPSTAFSEIKTSDKPKSAISDDAWTPPGFTVEDYRTVEQVNITAEENRKSEEDRNNGKVLIEHDISTSKECRNKLTNNTRRMNDITKYRSISAAQGYDEICRLRKKLNGLTGGPAVVCGQGLELVGNSLELSNQGSLQTAEEKYKDDAGGQISHLDDQGIEQNMIELKAKKEADQKEVTRLRSLVPQKEREYKNAREVCQERTLGCTQTQINKIARLQQEYYASVSGLEKAEVSLKKSTKDYNNIGQAIRSEQGALAAAGNDVDTNRENKKEADALSSAGEGENGALKGPVYDTNEQLKEAIERYTSNAASFAEEKIAETAMLEEQNKKGGDFEFYELALKDIDNATRGGKQALSNLDVMAMASAATTKIKCDPKRRHDSKAYHVFRAASATYIAATIGDQASYNESKGCIEQEVFNKENKQEDSQFELVSKALNSHTQMVDSMCLTVNPDPNNIPEVNGVPILDRDKVEKLKKICDASAGVTCAPGQEDGCAPRTRETALEMYETALMMAQHERTDKIQLVMTAEMNVKKGKKGIRDAIKGILVSTALEILHTTLAITFTSIAVALAGTLCGCSSPWFKKAAKATKEAAIRHIALIYFGYEFIKWTNFTKKWKRKREEAREHTHLACNFNEAKASESNQVAYAEKTKKDAKEAFDKAEQKVRNQIGQEGLGALGGKTGFIMPKGLSKNLQRFAVKTYLKKYIKEVGKSAFDLVFPAALATENLETDSNTETAVVSGGSSTRSGQALGMAIGSSSFYQFVIKQNQDWQVQAYDASTDSSSGYIKNDNPVLYCSEKGGTTGCIKEVLDDKAFAGGKYRQENSNLPVAGMPTPETRVKYMMAATELVRENISGTLGLLDQAVGQRDKYVMLINKMREQMNIKDKGNANQIEEKHVIKANVCMKETIGGALEIDQGCQCQKTNSCGELQYPELGEFAPGVLAVGEEAVKGVADKALSGKLDKANVETGNLSGNKSAVRRRITKNFADINKDQEKGGQGKIDFKKQAKNLINEGRKQAYRKYANLFPANVKQEKYRGGLSNYYNDMNLGSKSDGTSKSNQPALAAVGDTKKGGKGVASGLEGAGTGSANNKDQFNFDFEYGDEGGELTAAQRKAMEDQRALAALEASNRGKGSSSKRYRHERNLSLTDQSNSDNNGINKDTKKNIFNIISSRYKKSAFPIFLEDQFIR